MKRLQGRLVGIEGWKSKDKFHSVEVREHGQGYYVYWANDDGRWRIVKAEKVDFT